MCFEKNAVVQCKTFSATTLLALTIVFLACIKTDLTKISLNSPHHEWKLDFNVLPYQQ